jgi:hypothetical protein
LSKTKTLFQRTQRQKYIILLTVNKNNKNIFNNYLLITLTNYFLAILTSKISDRNAPTPTLLLSFLRHVFCPPCRSTLPFAAAHDTDTRGQKPKSCSRHTPKNAPQKSQPQAI